MSIVLIDEKTAYNAMYQFLVGYYERTHSDDVGTLLGGMSLLADGNTADPAIWLDWMNSLAKARESTNDLSLNLKS